MESDDKSRHSLCAKQRWSLYLAWIVGIGVLLAVGLMTYQEFVTRSLSENTISERKDVDIDNLANRSVSEIVAKLGQPHRTISRSIIIDDTGGDPLLRPTLELHYPKGLAFEFNYQGRMLTIRDTHKVLWP